MNRLTTRNLAVSALIAALYVVLSLAFAPISFGVYQIRIAEALTVLPFFLPAAIPGLYIGCVLANIFGGMGWLDIVVGPLFTLAAAILTRRFYHLKTGPSAERLGIVAAALIWISGIYLLTGFTVSLWTVVGAFLTLLAGAAVSVYRIRRDVDSEARREHLSARVIIGLFLTVAAIPLMRTTTDVFYIVAGSLLLLAAVATLAALTWTRANQLNPAVLLAPLPPVLLNAFGVSIYLAPIIGVNYWFSVQMVGVGELIACYLLGLPLLLLLRRRGVVG